MDILKSAGKTVSEIAGVMPNPTVHKLYEGVEIARTHKVDFILAVGGGSVVDYAKACLSPFTVKKIRGRNIMPDLKSRSVK